MKYLNYFTFFIEKKSEINTSIFENNFYFDPNDIFYTFCSLTHKTYPYGTEEQILKYMNIPLNKDEHNNYFIKIGESNTMFCSHLDSATKNCEKVKLIQFERNNSKYIKTDGNTILGADDKAGVTVMLYMIENKIPGLYYFFIGEEMGGIGSKNLSEYPENILENINKCISFDRKGNNSIITKQMEENCCSNIFSNKLCEEFKLNGLKMNKDDTGIFTDSANFINIIPECTNISVGYNKEHTKNEYQDITYLENLCKVCININWEKLPINRKLQKI